MHPWFFWLNISTGLFHCGWWYCLIMASKSIENKLDIHFWKRFWYYRTFFTKPVSTSNVNYSRILDTFPSFSQEEAMVCHMSQLVRLSFHLKVYIPSMSLHSSCILLPFCSCLLTIFSLILSTTLSISSFLKLSPPLSSSFFTCSNIHLPLITPQLSPPLLFLFSFSWLFLFFFF